MVCGSREAGETIEPERSSRPGCQPGASHRDTSYFNAAMRFAISSGETSSLWVAMAHR